MSKPGISGDARAVAVPHRSRVPWGAVGRLAVLLLLCFWVLFPLVVVVINSVESRVESVQRNIWPREFVSPIWARYEWVWRDFTLDNIFFRVYWNSLFVTALTVTFGTVAAILAGYALSHLATPGKSLIMLVFVASLFFPVQVTSMMGIFQLHWDLGLIDETWALMLPYVAASIAISIFIMRAVFQMISPELARLGQDRRRLVAPHSARDHAPAGAQRHRGRCGHQLHVCLERVRACQRIDERSGLPHTGGCHWVAAESARAFRPCLHRGA